MADDAGALLVRSGLVSAGALDQARAQVAEHGGTVGEQLVATGIVADDALTDFYKSRLLVPQVNPNTLARLPAKVVAVIPTDMAIELRAIPVSLDKENNLTVAMSDPSDRHAVDEIAFFTGSYVVRAVATQMQIAWCLAHYYGHVTALGERLLGGGGAKPPASRAVAAAVRKPEPAPPPVPVVAPAPAPATNNDGVPEATAAPEPERRARSVSGEIRAQRRAPSIKPAVEFEDESSPVRVPEPSGPVISIEAGEPSERVVQMIESEAALQSGPVISIEFGAPETSEEPTDRSRPAPPRRKRPAEPDPPELAARAGEVQAKSGPVRAVVEEPRIVIAEDLAPPPATSRTKTAPLENFEVPPELAPRAGELVAKSGDDRPVAPQITVEVADESEAVVIHEAPPEDSAPVLLDRRRHTDPADAPTQVDAPLVPLPDEDVEEEIVELPQKKPSKRPRGDRSTQLGMAVIAAATKARDEDDPTKLDTRAAPPGERTNSDEVLAAPPAPMSEDDNTSPVVIPPPKRGTAAVPPPSGKVKLDNVQARAPEPDEDSPDGRTTNVMTAVELDEVMSDRKRDEPRVDYDPVDDGWGPPGTTIPPPLLGAIPGNNTPPLGMIPLSNVDSAPLMVAPPAAPEVARADQSQQTLARALEDTTARVLELLSDLNNADDRDEVIALMINHLSQTHRRAGFFALRGGELTMFAMSPRPGVMPLATLRLDRPSTLQDVVGTRLPYRGPMHDDASRTFMAAVLGASPSEILLVPVTVRERVVGVLFGEQRVRHTFDDQLALAARAAGIALERILKARRG